VEEHYGGFARVLAVGVSQAGGNSDLEGTVRPRNCQRLPLGLLAPEQVAVRIGSCQFCANLSIIGTLTSREGYCMLIIYMLAYCVKDT